MSAGILERSIFETPISILDFETTGLSAGSDRVVEVTVVRCDPGSEPKLVIDTLVNPIRKVSATEIHGITDADVRNAPKFSDIAGDVIDALSGTVIAAYNVYFDIKFLRFELAQAGVLNEPPHFCLMYMAPLLGLGPRCTLEKACARHGISYESAHISASDSMVSARLFAKYLERARQERIVTFADLSKRKSYKFFESFYSPPFARASDFGLVASRNFLARGGTREQSVSETRSVQGMRRYWDLLVSSLGDFDLTSAETDELVTLRETSGLEIEQVRWLHAKLFSGLMEKFLEDQRIDVMEVHKLRRIRECLARLGWAPGD